ncbi:MAG TPA: hypothetical protein ENK57_23075 [Polyangiaceae bacterium]|nr:hypothetical protein [Polyangiaceae bacterium]
MSDSDPKKGNVVRRRTSERKRMPKHLEDFAGGDDDALWRRTTRRRLNDPRAVVLVPGVANRDARGVYEARVARILAAAEAEDREALAVELIESAQMQVWRGHSIVGWDVWVDAVLGLDPAYANELRGDAEPLNEELVALWMRVEAGLAEANAGAVRLRDGKLCFELDPERAPAALANVGRRAAPLAHDETGAKEVIVDRPRGVRKIIVDPHEDD